MNKLRTKIISQNGNMAFLITSYNHINLFKQLQSIKIFKIINSSIKTINQNLVPKKGRITQYDNN